MRRDDTGEDAWSALWNGDEAHDVQATGMLSAIVAPLAAGGVSAWVVLSYDGNLVLVPADRLDEASEVLQAADWLGQIRDLARLTDHATAVNRILKADATKLACLPAPGEPLAPRLAPEHRG